MKRSAYYSESLFDASLPPEQQPSSAPSSIRQRLYALWQTAIEQLFSIEDELQVWHTCDPSGQIWWNAYDPATQRSIEEVSETELRIWLENRYSFSSQPC